MHCFVIFFSILLILQRLLYSSAEGLAIPPVEVAGIGLGDRRNHTMDFVQWFLSVAPYQEQEKEEVVKKDPQPPSTGRGNKIYWTDQELEENPDLPYGALSNERNLLKLGGQQKLGKAELGGQQRLGKAELVTSTVGRSSVERGRLIKVELELPTDVNIRVGQTNIDRQLEVLSPETKLVEDQFQRIMFRLPNVIDQARHVIVKDISQKNMLGYSIAAAYFFAAFFDCVADLVLEERFWWLAPFQPSFLAFALWVWGYAAGSGGQFFFPDIFDGNDFSGDPDLACSSEDFFSVMTSRGLKLDLSSITDRRSRGNMLVLTANLKLDLGRSLACILSKTRDYREAQDVKTSLEEMLDLLPVHQELTGGPGVDDLAQLDQGLELLWQQLPQLVMDAREAVIMRRATRNFFYVVVGIFNVLGNIGAVMTFALPKKWSLLSSLFGLDKDIFSAINQCIATLLTTGQFTNPLGLGETLGIMASNSWGYSFYGLFFLFLRDSEPGCGLLEFEDVLMRYQELRSLEVLVSGGESSRHLARDVVTQWGREVETAVHCLLSENEGRLLGETVNMWIYLAQHRIDISSEMGIVS